MQNMNTTGSPLVLEQSNTRNALFFDTDREDGDCTDSVSLTSPRDPSSFSALDITHDADDCQSDGDDDEDADSLFKFIAPKIQQERDDAMNAALREHGYTRTRTILSPSLQGEVFEAECHVPAKHAKGKAKVKRVAIKKVCKDLYGERIAMEEDGMSFVVDEDVIKESIILNVLTVQHSPPADYICRFIEFFEDQFCFYLVQQYGGDQTLADFIDAAHRHIAAGRLALREWQKMSKYLFWQMMVVVNWMHDRLHCAHLDLEAANFLVKNGDFQRDGHDVVHINPRVSLKLCDFGCAEIFRDAQSVRCAKSSLSGRPQYRAPQVYAEECYDAKKADIYQLGLLLYRMAVGAELYRYQDSSLDAAFLCVEEGRIERHLRANNLGRFVNRKLVRLLNGMLSVNEKQRVTSRQVLTHEWFAVYYAKYQHRLDYGIGDNSQLSAHFPFYSLQM